MNNNQKEIIQYSAAIFMLLFGAGLCIAGFVVSPIGEVDSSVLWVLGQCILFSGSIFGLSIYVKDTVRNEFDQRLKK